MPAARGDRSSRPRHSPRRTPTRTERRIIKVRLARRWGPARIAFLLGLNPATVHRVLTRYKLARRRRPLAAPIAGLAVSVVAAVVAMPTGLPSEPGPAPILALMVLAYTAARVLPSPAATEIALCGTAVAGAGRFGEMLGYQTSRTAYTLGAEGWLIAVALGPWLRYLDRRHRDAADAVRRDERLVGSGDAASFKR